MKKSLLLILFIALSFSTSRAVEKRTKTDFYFVQITDTHFGPKKHKTRLKKIVGQVNRLPMKIEFVAITGDITSENIEYPAAMSNGLALFKKIKPTLHVIPGNHDIRPHKKDIMYKLYKKYFGKAYYQVKHNNVSCIFWYDEPYREGSLTIKGYDPLEWLKAQLENSKGKPVMIFLHAPPSLDFYNNSFHDSWSPKKREAFTTLINEYNVKGVFGGHFHRDEFHWLGKVPLYVSASVAGYWKRQATFRIYHYVDGKISYSTQYIE